MACPQVGGHNNEHPQKIMSPAATTNNNTEVSYSRGNYDVMSNFRPNGDMTSLSVL